jgi:glycosyltransferase involved in cell wall biosynthesis
MDTKQLEKQIETQRMLKKLNILIVADNASSRMGGEAILPLHYFKFLAQREEEVWLVTHDRVRRELQQTLSKDEFNRVYFISNTKFQILCSRLGNLLPRRIAEITFYWLVYVSTGFRQRQLVKQLVAKYKIDVVHQPAPVSPKMSSFLYHVGAPVIIGPMNGGMQFPPAFSNMESIWTRILVQLGRLLSEIMNHIFPGKKKATLLLVANERTRQALPKCACKNVMNLVENGVDLTLWDKVCPTTQESGRPIFTFLGFLRDMKGVDLLLQATTIVLKHEAFQLRIIGTGSEQEKLENLVKELRISDYVQFLGFVPQEQCPPQLRESRALVLPSLCECGGAVVLEAMAVGIPVIATNWGGPVDYITADCGMLITPSSKVDFINGLAEAIIRLARDEQLAKTMGQQGRKRIEALFSWQAKIDRIMEIYESVANKGT